MKRLLFFSLLFVLVSTAWTVAAQPLTRAEHRFTFDILSFKTYTERTDSVRVDIYLAVPYHTLTFLYAGDKYVADYGAIVQVTDQETQRMVTDKYQTYNVLESVSQHEQREEKGLQTADAEQFSFMLPAGRDFEVRLDIRDLSANHDFDTVVRYTTKTFTSDKPALSDLMIFRSHRAQRVMPSIGPDISALNEGEGGVFGELYNAPPNSVLGVVSQVYALKDTRDVNEDNVLTQASTLIRTDALPFDSGRLGPGVVPRTQIFQNLNLEDLWMGHYLLRTYILPSASDTTLRSPSDLHKRAIAVAERPISVTIQRGIPIVEADIDQAIEQLRMIANGSEWDSLQWGQNVKDKRDALIEFWRKRNPYPQDRVNRPMQVFYSRVQYANEHFSGGFLPGWKTDRGRVYVALGSPDFIDKHPYEAMQKPYEVWDYASLGVRYTFVDQYMLGDYRLVGPPPMPGTFLWER